MPTVLFVAAHTDDDLFGIGCSMVLHASDPDLRSARTSFARSGPTASPGIPTTSFSPTSPLSCSRPWRATAGPGLHRLLYSVIPQSWIDSWNAARELAGLWTWDPEQPFHLRGVPDKTVGVDVDTYSTVDTMMEAIRRHRTQWVYDDPAAEQELARSLVGEH
jgi:LmbE family N-acetylglucosaminyl deacetylase